MFKFLKIIFLRLLAVFAITTFIFIFLLGIAYIKGKQYNLLVLYFICFTVTNVLLGYSYYADFINKKIQTAFDEGDNETASYLIYKLAKRGHRDSQYRLSLLYRDGIGVEKDEDIFAFWLEKSAKSKPEAQFLYAVHLFKTQAYNLNNLKFMHKYLKNSVRYKHPLQEQARKLLEQTENLIKIESKK